MIFQQDFFEEEVLSTFMEDPNGNDNGDDNGDDPNEEEKNDPPPDDEEEDKDPIPPNPR